MNCRLLTAFMAVALTRCGPQPPAGGPPPAAPLSSPTSEPAAPEVSATSDTPATPQSGFQRALAFLEQHGEVVVLEAKHGARVVVSPKYQGRVMTSAVSESGESLGWVNEKFIESGKTGTQFDNYGGEDRFWLGPEGGQYGLFFAKGQPFEFAHWQTPAAFQEGAWKIAKQSTERITFEPDMSFDNYHGTHFEIAVQREISLMDETTVASRLGVSVPDNLQWVAYESSNEVVNRGQQAWTRSGGLLSIWILAQFVPSPDTWAILPFDPHATGPIVKDDYFGKVPKERLVVDEKLGALFFRCDGKLRSKIGLAYGRAKPVLGSYSASLGELTIVQYDLPEREAPYVNSMWEEQKAPYRGDVVNSYNDGPTEPGKPALGGFYELETSSPGAPLAQNGAIVHHHRTFHFVGEAAALDPIAQKVLGVGLTALPK